ncbi:pyridoxal phosphate-dependent aminotransferase [Pontibacter beigongshangensis]|uniref:pyridoxal phosphate-dependent aminotransferase n=1 Tax=Pontibacter beigongshangensis TaxID=2574733 RepID=UPI00164FCDD8|nr:aminotransferase class I/II-fold pyridoxal phosphate-dependent enzyme [Pontibacter beigongshangensis]
MKEINLASGASYFRSPAPAITVATKELEAGATGHGSAEGLPELREAIAQRYKNDGVELTPEQVLITPGCKQALFYLFSTLLQDDDELLVPTPAWFGFQQLMDYSKGKLVQLPTTAASNYTLDPADLREALNERSRILLLTNPGNPTGRMYTRQELEDILSVTNDFPNLYVVSDEIYDFVTYDGAFSSILSCQGATEKVVVTNGFSKSFAMTDWRIGYLVGSPELVRKCTGFQAATIAGVSKFMQKGAAAALQERDQVLPPMLEVLQQNRSLTEAALSQIPHLLFFLPQGAYYFFPDISYYLPCTTPTGAILSSSAGLCQYLKEAYALELLPGDPFGAPGHVRMSFAIETEQLTEALSRLKKALHELVVSE